ncbi:MAG: hypothetical protein J6S85_07190 [Methanobrevibacter sp.]|nr:hypothetical protein [Methanobrevibacter sp.]
MRKAIRMSFETIMSFVAAIVVPLVVFLFKESSSTKKDLADYKKEVAEKYAPREEIKRIEDKLDNLYQLILDRLPKKGS